LPNTVVAADLEDCAATVTIEGERVATIKSHFAKSTGNEVSRSTGGGVISHATQGMAFFLTASMDVIIEGERAVRDGDLTSHNHLAKVPSNTPASIWMSGVSSGGPAAPPGKSSKGLHEGKDWIEIEMVDLEGEVVAREDYSVTTPTGRKVDGHGLLGGIVEFNGLAKGECQVVFPGIDANPTSPGRKATDKIDSSLAERGKQSKADKIYVAGKPLSLATGKSYRIELPRRPSYWLELTIRRRDAKPRGCSYVLRSTDGNYEVERTLADDLIRHDGALVLKFPDLCAGRNYTLVHKLDGKGATRVVFSNLPYARLRTRMRDLKASEPEPRQIAIKGVAEDLRRIQSARLRDRVREEDSLPGLEVPE
jgi:hypothetical protein